MARHLSVSQIERFCHCPERWRLSSLEKIPEPSTPPMIRGTAVDRAVTKHMLVKREGAEMPLEETEQVAADEASRAFSAGSVLLAGDDADRGVSAVKGETIDQAVALATLHHIRVAPTIRPVTVQEKIVVSIPGLPDIWAVLDLTDDSGAIRDTKTSGRKPDPEAARLSLQLTQYDISYTVLHKKPPTALVLDQLVHYKPSKSRPDGATEPFIQIEPPRSKEVKDAYLERVAAVDKAMQAGVAIPAATTDWKCSPRWCGYYGTACKYTRGMLKPR